jgi:hypothetical protein
MCDRTSGWNPMKKDKRALAWNQSSVIRACFNFYDFSPVSQGKRNLLGLLSIAACTKVKLRGQLRMKNTQFDPELVSGRSEFAPSDGYEAEKDDRCS